jgi:hypothetical protein
MSRYRTLFCGFGVHLVPVELSRPNITSSVKFCSNMVQLGGHVGNGGIALVTCPRSHLDPSSALRPLFLSLLFSEHPHCFSSIFSSIILSIVLSIVLSIILSIILSILLLFSLSFVLSIILSYHPPQLRLLAAQVTFLHGDPLLLSAGHG